MSKDLDLILISHPRSGERFAINKNDLEGDPEALIPLYEKDGTRRSRADAWLGSGRPSDILRSEAKKALDNESS